MISNNGTQTALYSHKTRILGSVCAFTHTICMGKIIRKKKSLQIRIEQNLTLFGDRHDILRAGRWDAQVVVRRETVTFEHLWPREAERVHEGRAASPDALAQRPARLDGLVQVVQADGSEQRAEELPRVRVTLLLDQGDPGGGLLQDLVHGFVSEQVRQTHLRVLDVVAELEFGGNLLTVVLFVEQVVLAEVVQSVDGFRAGGYHPQGGQSGNKGSHFVWG